METIAASHLQLVLEDNEKLNKENEQLKLRVVQLEQELNQLNSKHSLDQSSKKNTLSKPSNITTTTTIEPPTPATCVDLSLTEYLRYGRQLILAGFGLSAQKKLKATSILIVGAGGLGAPAAIYLAACGVGRLGIVDYDVVETSNLHRQIIHNESRAGLSKAQSAKMTVEGLNSFVECNAYDLQLDSSNALPIIKGYDIIIDATDNVATRYLLNDACVITGKPLVSGSALRMEGQLTIYNYRGGPCYRCLYPKPPPPETVTNCADGGILGETYTPNLLLFSAASHPLFRSIKLRPKKSDCEVCGNKPSISKLQDYVQFCGIGVLDKSPTVKLLGTEERINPKEYAAIRAQKARHILLDVREKVQFEICHLPDSINIPLRELPERLEEVKQALPFSNTPVYTICRLGNDSQHAVPLLRGITQGEVKDVIGGFYRWSKDVDTNFPIY
ncbi:10765_t:CDS:10 [Ambispora gerdemannii]|uniref:Needs CLA4 to survive protein 3 n=1 Tax=Ambispora gerdemannii TaxID=144530 RepID=A0A9N9GSK8_9GLOM|nr:10765_t:CDS:10 [Ambispora gerdemannii]